MEEIFQDIQTWATENMTKVKEEEEESHEQQEQP